MDDLLNDFVAEAREMLAALSGEIVAWEADPSDRARLDAIFRFVHTVKGNCGFFDLPRLEQLSHAAEDALGDCRAGRRHPDHALVSAVLAVIDRIAELVEDIDAGRDIGSGGDEALTAALGQIAACEAPDTAPLCQPEYASPITEPAGATQSNRVGVQRTIRLPVELLDRVMSGVSDMAVVRNDLARRIAQTENANDLQDRFARLSAVLDDLSDAITAIRMQRVETLFAGFPRLVRDLSHELGKQVAVVLESGDVEIDRELIEVVRDPLVHIIRNAVDHGIEQPGDRVAAGKPATGTIRITARQTGSHIRIGVVDDGRGIDVDRLVRQALAAGRVTADEVAAMSPRERNALVFASGVSTASAVTAVSGRGVGMDVVRANIEKIGGTVAIDTTPGDGTRMMITIPLTLSIVPSLTLDVAGQVFAMPRSYVEEIVKLSTRGGRVSRTGGRTFIELGDRTILATGLGEVLGIPDAAPPADGLFVLIKLVGGDMFGLGVDAIIDHEDLVVTPLAPVLMQCGFYVGSTLLDSGHPIPMLDIAGIARAAGMIGEVRSLKVTEEGQAAPDMEQTARPALLFEGFDGAVKAIEMGAVRRIEKLDVAGVRPGTSGEAHVAIEGRIVPLIGLRDVCADFASDQRVAVFSVGEGEREVAYAYRRMIDLVTYDAGDVTRTESTRLALIGERPVELLDAEAVLRLCHQLSPETD